VVDGHYVLSEAQARAILELRLHRLTGLERDKIAQELQEIGEQIKEYLHILSSREKLYEILRAELQEMKEQFATPRRTTIEENEFEADIEDLIAREDMVVTVTSTGYIKRVPLSAYRAQKRGGKGRSGMSMRDEDVLAQVFVVNTHTPVLFFSSTGRAYKMKVYRLPLGNPQARGKALINLLPLDAGETISTIMPMPEDENTWQDLHVMFATASGNVRRNLLSDFVDVRANGKIAMKLDEGDKLIGVQTCTEDDDVLLSARAGNCIRFPVSDVRVFKGRDSTGVRGMRLVDGDTIMSMAILKHARYDMEVREAYLKESRKRRGEEGEAGVGEWTEDFARMADEEQFLLTVSERGFGKRTSSFEYRITGRGGSGIANFDVTKKTGQLAASFPVLESDDIMIVTDGGKLIRTPVAEIGIKGRKTQGVMLLRTAEEESVVSVTRLAEGDAGENGEAEETEEGGGPNQAEGADGGDE
jgi:DNA gyrase subunit A